MIQKIDAVVVLYNPEESIIENIKSYQQVNTIYAVDNSEKISVDLVEKLETIDNLVYINNNGNQGIANALNIGAQRAIENGAEWLLTMDQDSKFVEDGFERLKVALEKLIENRVQIGLIAPSHKQTNNEEYKKQLVVMTSGNIVNLKAYQDVGGFEEKLFIDAVDYDFCLKLNLAKYKVIEYGNAILEHQLGTIIHTKLLWINFKLHVHPPIRTYYCLRNAIYLLKKYYKKYPLFTLFELKSMIMYFFKIFIINNKKAHFMNYIIGISDALLNKFGKKEYKKDEMYNMW